MKIYLSSWCLKEYLHQNNLSLLELPELATKHGFHGIEIMDRQLPALDACYLKRLKAQVQNFDCGLILDVSNDLTSANETVWRQQINYVDKMLHVAKQMGASKVRILLGGQSFSLQKFFSRFAAGKETTTSNPQKRLFRRLFTRLAMNRWTARLSHSVRKRRTAKIQNELIKIKRAIQALQKIVSVAETFRIPLVIENHWGISSRPANIVQIVQTINSPFIGTCPDFDNFPRDINRYDGLRMLAPHALHVHAKSFAFNAAAEEKNIDYSLCTKILQQSGYGDTIAIEYEGTGDALEGCLRPVIHFAQQTSNSVILSDWKERRISYH